MRLTTKLHATPEELNAVSALCGFDLAAFLRKQTPLDAANTVELTVQMEASFLEDLESARVLLGFPKPASFSEFLRFITQPKTLPNWPPKLGMMEKAKIGMMALQASRKISAHAVINATEIPLPLGEILLKKLMGMA